MESFLIIALNKVLELFGNDLFSHWEHMLGNVWNFNQQSTGKINSLQSLQVNMHVERNLTSELFDFKLNRLLLKLHGSLSKQLTVSHVLANINETVVSLFDSTTTEESQTNLGDSSIVNYLIINCLETNDSLDMSLKEQVLSFHDSVMKGMVENLAKGGAHFLSRFTLFVYKIYKSGNLFLSTFLEVSVLKLFCLVSQSRLNCFV